jgi:hypothetical protein
MKSAREHWTMHKWTATLSILRWRMPSQIGQQNAGAAAAGVVVCRDMRATRSLGLEVMGRGKNKIHVHRRTTWTDHHGEVRVEVEVRVGGAGEGKAKGQARRGAQKEEIDHREFHDTNRVVPLPLSILRPDYPTPTSKCAILLVPISSFTRALFL